MAISTNPGVVHVVGGGTISHVRRNLAVSAISFGETARKIVRMCEAEIPDLEVRLHLTRMANCGMGTLETNEDVSSLVKSLVADESTSAIFLPVALCAFSGAIVEGVMPVDPDPDLPPISRSNRHAMILSPISEMTDRVFRNDMVVVGFVTTADTADADLDETAARHALMHRCHLVVAKDLSSGSNVLAVPGSVVARGTRDEVLLHSVRSAGEMMASVRRPPPACFPHDVQVSP